MGHLPICIVGGPCEAFARTLHHLKLLMLTDFLLVPTRADCAPIVFGEADAFGLPVITTNTGGVSEIVRDGENGFLLPYGTRGVDYAEVIARIYSDDERYAELVQASRAAFEDRLNWDAWGDRCQADPCRIAFSNSHQMFKQRDTL